MSHHTLNVNGAYPNSSGDITATTAGGVVLSYRGNTGSVAIGYPSTGYASGSNIPFYVANATYYELHQASGIGFNHSSYSPLGSNLAYAFKDEVTLPTGEYDIAMFYAPYGSVVGECAWVENNATATRYSPVFSTTTARQATYCRFRVAVPNSSLSLGCRILTGRGNGSSVDSIRTMSFIIRKL